MSNTFLEQFYENVILPKYKDEVSLGKVTWRDHNQVGMDSRAHWFKSEDGTEYVLLWEDFPDGSYLGDGLSHELIRINGEASISLQFADKKEVKDVTGYFTLFREKKVLA
jgi:hypothetical protein